MNVSTDLITDEQTLESAKQRNHAIPIYDDCSGQLWVHRNEYGVCRVIRAGSWEDAYDIVLDESPPIPLEDVPEAYNGFDLFADEVCKANGIEKTPSPAWSHVVDFCSKWLPVWWDIKCRQWQEEETYPELDESYTNQPNATGSGIVWIGHSWLLELLTREDCKNWELELVITDDEVSQ